MHLCSVTDGKYDFMCIVVASLVIEAVIGSVVASTLAIWSSINRWTMLAGHWFVSLNEAVVLIS